MCAHGEKVSITRPLDTSYAIIWPDIAQFCHLAIHGRPEVDAGAEADGEHILARPVH